jgi:hypothetical protein
MIQISIEIEKLNTKIGSITGEKEREISTY